MSSYSRITINGHLLNEKGEPLEPEMLAFAFGIASRWNGRDIVIHANFRNGADLPAYKNPDWLEWMLHVSESGTHQISICLIQRTKTAEFESHS
jgi:hypothetical protein